MKVVHVGGAWRKQVNLLVRSQINIGVARQYV